MVAKNFGDQEGGGVITRREGGHRVHGCSYTVLLVKKIKNWSKSNFEAATVIEHELKTEYDCFECAINDSEFSFGNKQLCIQKKARKLK